MTEPSKLPHHGVPEHQPAAGGIAARARAAAGPQYLSGLNPEQREAVETLDGPVLVLAGAGTGKTRVLTTRIAHILSQGRARPHEILSVTFTNKAAREMKLRLGQMLGQAVEGMPWLGTFHSIGGRILRIHAELAQLKSNFTVLDVDDQVRLLKQLLQAENIDDKRWPARMLAGLIDGWKNRGLSPSQVPAGEAASFGNGKGGKIYATYQERLKILNAADFGDLLLENIRLFRENPDVLRQYQSRFKFILVDEYQDTNVAQYLWLRLLSQAPSRPGRALSDIIPGATDAPVIPGRAEGVNPESDADDDSARDSGSAPAAHPGMTENAAIATQLKNICCVGDDDQSIYGWRGAEVDNILRFEHDFPGAKVIRLERNYRSTGHILAAASHLIAHNEGRLGKTLRTEDVDGEKVTVTGSWDSEEEARAIGEELEELQRAGENLNDVAILVRASFQMREFEDRFVTLGLPYRVIGGPRFYERAEIRDALAYLRTINSPADDLAFERIVNVPKRGLGDATVQLLHDHARKRRIPLFEAARAVVETDELKPKARGSLRDLVMQFHRWRAQREVTSHTELAEIVLDESGYTEMWQKDRSADAAGRLENLKELVRSMEEFENLQGFLEHISLVMDRDGEAGDEAVSLMTLHSAKGLEFDNVFLPGWEEGLFPSQRTLDEQGRAGLEEERRLAHVGLTRARRRAKIYFATNRRIHGTWSTTIPSRFLDELPAHNVEITESKGGSGWGGSGGYGASRFDNLESFGSSYSTPGWQRAQANRNRGGGGRGGSGFEERQSSFSGSRGDTSSESFNRTKRGPMVIEGELVAKSTGTTSDFSLDDRVFHQKFGYGHVVKIDGNKLTIAFEKAGEKKVVDSFVQRV
ncbi:MULTISPECIES: ATP-dependent helicase [Bradyrhizobium]|jgi:ATP-dependent DNA helicase UvrD/PcrA|uniref:ATP-dependent helicase n=1 Tax=Bradyrhizobium TaxID=374 RepID=UPI00048A0B23|nr:MULTISPECIES: UvrD-helicase domain-containing protein [Bradyrhizobium]MCS3451654.1 DNA helicase-2/ATP-dependent DNA helicase PcrA [Bradyrhizobium elkanii]MCS3566247.1 DNA helicase-2/ATP-dependent DNA helicase PcrA [Bradyrhizobium elkanii]MCW2153023.1 DNA helicase-2/ATP-dependent DNA helicase PcrA [Bradyrhizobium elkanii]MCW2357238.1 DNA helicase-2/ATP-dependent DNA helicase PcrA [Bradyrhizobium elkanii]MCW2376756.1 DNA helicase-2/ATP-dependent DNA helicase PcrA [Bradyrhizobium elkanii]